MMWYLQVAAAVAAVFIAGGPLLSKAWTAVLERVWAAPDGPAPLPIAPNYQSAMQSLASVRLRLVRTDCFSKDVAEAVKVLTLALLNGSDE